MLEKAEKSQNEIMGNDAKAAALLKREGKGSLRVVDNREMSSSQTEMQMMIDHSPRMAVQRKQIEQTFEPKLQRLKRPENKTGLPDNLKTGIENLSGLSLDNVRVHSNSTKPATVGAHAYTQGTDIHVAPGQMKHLPHEAWHVVQQMQGRVQPTGEIAGLPVNDSTDLEKEADIFGAKAT